MVDLKAVKNLLKKEPSVTEATKLKVTAAAITVMPILHNDKKIILQFWGWSVNLHADGTWYWEDTTG